MAAERLVRWRSASDEATKRISAARQFFLIDTDEARTQTPPGQAAAEEPSTKSAQPAPQAQNGSRLLSALGRVADTIRTRYMRGQNPREYSRAQSEFWYSVRRRIPLGVPDGAMYGGLACAIEAYVPSAPLVAILPATYAAYYVLRPLAVLATNCVMSKLADPRDVTYQFRALPHPHDTLVLLLFSLEAMPSGLPPLLGTTAATVIGMVVLPDIVSRILRSRDRAQR